jgi:thiol-disulfide isomerase/thioredoxin
MLNAGEGTLLSILKGVSMFGLTLTVCLQVSMVATAPTSGASYSEAYREAHETGKPLVVLVGADWCPGCQTMKRSVIPALKQSGDLALVSFAAVNTEIDRELAGKLMQGGSIPQLIVYKKTETGWHREQLTGAKSVSETRGLLRRVAQRLTGR